MTWRGFFEGIGELSYWAFDGLKLLGQGFNGIGVANVFWMLTITVLIFIGLAKCARKQGVAKNSFSYKSKPISLRKVIPSKQILDIAL